MCFNTFTVSYINASISSADLYAIGASSMVDSHTDVEYMSCICWRYSSMLSCFLAAERDISLPAPWGAD